MEYLLRLVVCKNGLNSNFDEICQMLTKSPREHHLAVMQIDLRSGNPSDGHAVQVLTMLGHPIQLSIVPGDWGPTSDHKGILTPDSTFIAYIGAHQEISFQWFQTIIDAIHSFPEADLFCGPVRPILPGNAPLWLEQNRLPAISLAEFSPSLPLGILPDEVIPTGLNFAFRASVLQNYGFTIGIEHKMPLRWQLLSLALDLKSRRRAIIYDPNAIMTFRVSHEAISLEDLFANAFFFGQAYARSGTELVVYPMNWLDACRAHHAVQYFETGSLMNLYLGQFVIHLERGRPSLCNIFSGLIAGINWRGEWDIYCMEARKWLEANRAVVRAYGLTRINTGEP